MQRRGAGRLRPVLGVIGGIGAAALIGGCAIFGGGGDKPEAPPGPKTVTLNLAAVDLLNSCDEGVGNALTLRVYQLSGDARISMSALGTLWGNENAELGKELVDKSELILEPGAKVPFEVHPTSGAQYLAVVGNFCKSEGNCWRWIRPLAEIPSKVTLNCSEHCIESAAP